MPEYMGAVSQGAGTQAISTRFDVDTLLRLNEIAEKQNRPRSEIIKEAVGDYLDSMAWFQREVRKGLDDAATGRVVSHEDFKAELRSLGLNVP